MRLRASSFVLFLSSVATVSCEPMQFGPRPVAAAPCVSPTASADGVSADVHPPQISPQPIIHTGTIVPAKHPDRGGCSPFQEGSNATCVAGFFGAMVVTDIDFGDCSDELMVLAVTIGLEAKVDVSHAHWYLLNPPHSHLSIHGAQFAVEATEELVFAARPTSGATPSPASGCFVTWSSKVLATSFSYPRLE